MASKKDQRKIDKAMAGRARSSSKEEQERNAAKEKARKAMEVAAPDPAELVKRLTQQQDFEARPATRD